MIEIKFYHKNQIFFYDDCNELWKYIELNKENWNEFISNYKFNKNNLINTINSMSIESEIMSKIICNFFCNVDIDFSIS